MTKKAKIGWVLPVLWCFEFSLGCGSGIIGTNCEHVCSPASLSECADGKIRSCLPDAAGCLNWGNWAACETGACTDAFSCSGCSNGCAVSGNTRCHGGNLSRCEADDRGCLDWGGASPCETGGCADAVSCQGCANGCAASGSTRCESGSLSRCEADAKGCLDWGTASPCASGICADSERCAACENSCPAAGTTDCSNGEIRICVTDSKNCLAWDQPAACPSGSCLDHQVCAEEPQNGDLVFDGRFEATDSWSSRNHWESESWSRSYNCCILASDRLTVVQDPRGTMGYVGRFTVKDGDACNAAAGERSELSSNTFNQSDLYYGFSVMFDSSWKNSGTWGLFFQTMDELYQASPELGLFMHGTSGKIILVLQPHTTYGPGNSTEIDLLPALENNLWHYWVVHMKWSKTNDGIVEVWYRKEGQSDYNLLRSIPNIKTEKDCSNGYKRAQYGLYRGDAATITQILFHGRLKIGTSRADVE